ncbi:hypothetical protein SLA2020_474660 [Shorea laevis]
MDRDSYNAAAEGKIDFFKAITDQALDLLLTPNKNTVLHIYITTFNLGSESIKSLNAGSESITLNARSESTTLNARSEPRINFVEKFLKCVPHCYGKPMPKVKLHCTCSKVRA